jgi:hypothetical protein
MELDGAPPSNQEPNAGVQKSTDDVQFIDTEPLPFIHFSPVRGSPRGENPVKVPTKT